MQTARFFYNKTTEEEAIKWLTEQEWNIKDSNGNYKVKYIILDFTLIGKASALTFLGTNYYQYPNGETAVDGVCKTGEVCQNIENGLVATEEEGTYSCSQGIVCPRDAKTKIKPKMCCEENPTQCCDSSLDWKTIQQKGGTAKIIRAAGSPVYGQYHLNTKGAICQRPELATSNTPIFMVVDGQRKTVANRALFTLVGEMPLSDGQYYPAFAIFNFADGTQETRLVTENCEVKSYDEVGTNLDSSLTQFASNVFISIPDKWKNSMFTQLYLRDAKNLEYIDLIETSETRKFYPNIKIYRINYPNDLSVLDKPPETQETEEGVVLGDKVAVEYTGRLENGTVFDSSVGEPPLEFVVGEQGIIPGFQKAVLGMTEGESKMVSIPPEEAYGVNGTHPLAGKTLVFEITLVSINADTPEPEIEPEMEAPDSNGTRMNITFDNYDPDLVEEYGLKQYPAIVWNCQFKKLGKLADLTQEMDLLGKVTCIVNNGEPTDICTQLGIFYNDAGELSTNVPKLNELLKQVKKIGDESCKPETGSKIQVFYPPVCDACAEQKPLLDILKATFADQLSIEYHCVGDEATCSSISS
jgi:hypothetical protein